MSKDQKPPRPERAEKPEGKRMVQPMQLSIEAPTHWEDYVLLDSGQGWKVEQFGKFKTLRPEPQALWTSERPVEYWERNVDAQFKSQTSQSGEWITKAGFPESWTMQYKSPLKYQLQFKLRLTSFKHVGIFPEQAANWDYLYSKLKAMQKTVEKPKVLNLFAYTGGASLAAKAAGADVIHLDSVKQVIHWANDNQVLSGLKDIRWLVEDALKFVEREAKRGNVYNAIILDPPAYGIGPKGERWKLEQSIHDLLSKVLAILHPEHYCLVVNTYSLNLSPIILHNIIQSIRPLAGTCQLGELGSRSPSGLFLPLGAFYRVGGV